MTAHAGTNVSYMEASWDSTKVVYTEKTASATPVTSTDTTWNDGWYVVNSDVTNTNRITVSGTVNLILCDGCTLTANSGIELEPNNIICIYGQTDNTGKLTAHLTDGAGNPGIGPTANVGTGDFIMHGGVVDVQAGGSGTGIGGFGGNPGCAGGNVTVYGGNLTAIGSYNGAGIGGNTNSGQGGSVIIYGGNVYAEGKGKTEKIGENTYAYGSAGIGGGGTGAGGSVEIYGGTVTAVGGGTLTKYIWSLTGGNNTTNTAYGIGSGWGSTDNGTLTIGEGAQITTGTNSSNASVTNASFNGGAYSDARTAYMKIEWLHTHIWSYTANDNTITATCTGEGDCPVGSKTLTLNASDATYTGSAYSGASLLNAWTSEDDMTAPGDIFYEGINGTSYASSTTAPTDVGTYQASVTVGSVTATKQFSITRAEISPTVTIDGWTYGDTASDPSVTGNSGNGTVTYTYQVNKSGEWVSTKPTTAGTHTVKATIAATDNYNGNTATADFAIGKRPVTITGVSVADKTYDGATTAEITYAGEITGAPHEDAGNVTVIAGSAAFDDANVGTQKSVTLSGFSLGGDSAGNYILSSQPAAVSANITARPVTVTAKAQSVELNGTIDGSLSQAMLTGAVSGHTLTAVTLTPTDVSHVGSSTVVPGNATIKSADEDVTNNYAITYAVGALTVTKAQPKLKPGTTLTATPLTYGQELGSATITGQMVDKSNEETEVSGTFSWEDPTKEPQVSDSDTTEYDVIFTPDNSDDYGPVQLKTTVTVNPKELTVKADDKQRILGAKDNPELTYTVTGLIGTDTEDNLFTGSLSCAADSYSTLGSKVDITQGNLATANANYSIGTFIEGTMTVILPEIWPTTIQPGSLTSTGAKLSGAVSPADYATDTYLTSVGFKYRKKGALIWENVTGTIGATYSAEISGLTPDTDYEYYAILTMKDGVTVEDTDGMITFHTQKKVLTDTGQIEVNVKIDSGSNTDVVVSVERGNDIIASDELSVTTSGGSVTFKNLPDGYYNVVTRTKDGDFTETKMLSIESGAKVKAEFIILEGKVATLVEVEGEDTPKVAVDGLNDILTNDDKNNAAEGKQDVEIKLEVEKKEETKATGHDEIKSLLDDRETIDSYLDLSLFKTVTDLSNETTGSKTNIGSTNTKILCIAIPYDFGKRSGFFVARYHSNTAERLNGFAVKPTGDYTSEGYFIDMASGYIFLYASGFSTYAVGYEEPKDDTAAGSTDDTAAESTDDTGTPAVSGGEQIAVRVSDETPASETEQESKTAKDEKAAAVIDINAGLKVSQTGKKVTVRWGKVDGAYKYAVYATYCGTEKFRRVGTVRGNKKIFTFKKLLGRKLNLKKDIKVYVVAYRKVNGKETQIARSITAHIAGKGNAKYTNVRNIRLLKKSYALKSGGTAKLKAKVVLVDKKKKQLSDDHTSEFRYVSDNKKVATVNEKGRIKAVGIGTCHIYVYAKNGYAKKIKVTVK